MAKKKHIPQRTCIGCRTVKSKRDMIRIVRTPAQTLIIDSTGKANGRGVYVCTETQCLEKGLKKERLAQALKITPSDEVVAQLFRSVHDELSKA
ncbi:MAG: YlxR family protein [Anaerolineae bacterium]|nr:YlxR family protein [Anaerolineae bacterium]